VKVGDLIKFKGTWGSSVAPGERQTGIVMEVWTNGRTRKQQGADILWDNGDFSRQFSVHNIEVTNEGR
tara:strand:- start:59 stop:262 length:204 start_codon:yes stop_codon:yes gene_type:complete